jgi:hypothetical protein
MTNKFFFMAVLSGMQQGRPIMQFNTVTGSDSRNITALGLNMIQESGAEILRSEGVQFDNVLVNNIFFLAECTADEFFPQEEPANEAEAEVEEPAPETDNEEVVTDPSVH